MPIQQLQSELKSVLVRRCLFLAFSSFAEVEQMCRCSCQGPSLSHAATGPGHPGPARWPAPRAPWQTLHPVCHLTCTWRTPAASRAVVIVGRSGWSGRALCWVLVGKCARAGGRMTRLRRLESVGRRRQEGQLVSQKRKYSALSAAAVSIQKQVEISSAERNV